MNKKRFKSVIDEDTMSIMPYLVSDNEEECFYNLQGCVDLLNEYENKCNEYLNEIQRLNKVIDLMEYQMKVQDRIIKEYEDGD